MAGEATEVVNLRRKRNGNKDMRSSEYEHGKEYGSCFQAVFVPVPAES
jgi:hypothetical protein